MFKWFRRKNKKEDETQEKQDKNVKIGAEDKPGEDNTESEQPVKDEIEKGGKKSADQIEKQSNDEDFKDESQDKSEDVLEEDCEDEIEVDSIDETKPEKLGFFEKLKSGLTKTRDNIAGQIDSVLRSYTKVDDELFDDLEEILVTADVGVSTTMELIDRLRDRVKDEKVNEPDKVKELLKDEIKKLMIESIPKNDLNIKPSPAVMLVVGVNGVGKTTTIGKLANNFKNDGEKVLLAAADTFRAAAIEQLEEWSHRSGVDLIAHSEGSDPAAVVYDGIQAAKARNTDILICDTAGRLHNKSNLMNELNKIFRIVEREYGNATKEVLLVLDATTGQNAINQAKVFKEVTNITGVALTKLDGTAKGGVVIALQSELKIPIKLVGVGEGIDDLQPFNTEDFVEALFD